MRIKKKSRQAEYTIKISILSAQDLLCKQCFSLAFLFGILSQMVIIIAPRDTAPSLLEDTRWIKPCARFEATERS